MTVALNIFFVQNVLLFVLIVFPSWILCKAKKKANPPTAGSRGNSSETLAVKSAIKPPVTDTTASQVAPVKEEKKEEAPKEEPPKEEKKEGKEEKPEEKKDEKKEDKKDEDKKDEKKDEKPKSGFASLPMMTASTKKKRLEENERDKNEKIKNGFFQEKSDEDDTLEKVTSLKVEQSDRTKRSVKKNKK